MNSANPRVPGRAALATRLATAYRWFKNPYAVLDEVLRQGRLTTSLQLPMLGDVLVTGDPALIQQITQHPQLQGGHAVRALRSILGSRSLIMLDQDRHLARRRLIAPLFCGPQIRRFDRPTAEATREELSRIRPGTEFCGYEFARRIALRVIVEAMFGGGESSRHIGEQRVEAFLRSFRSALILFLRPLHVNLGRWTPWGRAVAHRRHLIDYIRQRIEQSRRRQGGTGILGQLVIAAEQTGQIDDEEIVEDVLSLLLFGHDTGAATMAWAFAHLFQNPGLTERLRAMVCASGADENPDRCEWLKACLQESMRLCPVVVHVSRTAMADVQLGDHRLRAGQSVLPCGYLAHRNPAIFPHPDVFAPERFLDGNLYEHAFFPFGLGHRICVGMPFVLRQMQVILATSLATARLELSPGYEPVPQRRLVLIVPRNGTLLRRRAS